MLFVCFTAYYTKQNPSKNYEMYHLKWRFLLFWGFIMRMKMSFMVLEIWSFGSGKALEKL